MENKQEKLSDILNSIKEAAQCDDQDMLLETLENIPEEFWTTPDCFVPIMETFFDWIFDDFAVIPTRFIPDSFWEDNIRVEIYANILYGLYLDGKRVDYNLSGELIPQRFLNTRRYAELFLRVNYFETIGSIQNDLLSNPHTVFIAFSGLDYAIEQRAEDSCTLLQRFDPEECYRDLLNQIPQSFASDKAFVLELFQYHCRCAGSKALFDWIDAKLWSDEEVVKEFWEAGCEIYDRISEDLLADEEFQTYLNEN